MEGHGSDTREEKRKQMGTQEKQTTVAGRRTIKAKRAKSSAGEKTSKWDGVQERKKGKEANKCAHTERRRKKKGQDILKSTAILLQGFPNTVDWRSS